MAKTDPNHKFGGMGTTPSCYCGWYGVPHFGQGQRSHAYAEWSEHVQKHQPVTAKVESPYEKAMRLVEKSKKADADGDMMKAIECRVAARKIIPGIV